MSLVENSSRFEVLEAKHDAGLGGVLKEEKECVKENYSLVNQCKEKVGVDDDCE